MKIKRPTVEETLYILAVLLALVVRLIQLGKSPLSDSEAGWALQALGLARGDPVTIGSQPGYVVITSLLFSILGSSNTLARLWPVLAGGLLVLFPIFIRKSIGRTAALVMAFGLAFDPLLVALSRIPGSSIPAMAFGVLALGAGYNRRFILAGFCAGLALLSGPAFWPGALAIALAWGVSWALEKTGAALPLAFPQPRESEGEPTGISLRLGLFVLAGTLLLAGTLFFRDPQGLGALGDAIPAYLRGWANPSGVPALRLPAALLVYQPLAVIFGLVGFVRSWMPGLNFKQTYQRWPTQRSLSQRLSLWAIFALALGMLYPSRQVGDLTWVVVPLWGLAAIELAPSLAGETEVNTEQKVKAPLQNWQVSLGQAVLLILLSALAWMNLAGVGSLSTTLDQASLKNTLYLIVGAAIIGSMTTLLVSLGWMWDIARRGLVWGVGTVLLLYQLSGVGHAALASPGQDQELYSPTPVTGQADLLISTLRDLSEWNTGQRNFLDVVSLVDSSALRWELRNWLHVSFTSELLPDAQPSAIITYQDQQTPKLTSRYRGEGFAWEVYPNWQGILPPNPPRWLAFRDAPHQSTQIILWARSDLNPGGSSTTPGTTAPLPGDNSLPQINP